MTREILNEVNGLQLVSINYQNTFILQIDNDEIKSCVIAVENNYKIYKVLSIGEESLYIELYLSPEQIMALNLLGEIEVNKWVKESGLVPVYKKYKIMLANND